MCSVCCSPGPQLVLCRSASAARSELPPAASVIVLNVERGDLRLVAIK